MARRSALLLLSSLALTSSGVAATASVDLDGAQANQVEKPTAPPTFNYTAPLMNPIPQSLIDRLEFLETFQADPFVSGGWVKSVNARYVNQAFSWDSVHVPVGKEPSVREPYYKDEKSLSLRMKHAHYGIVNVLNKPFDNKDKDLVAQYEVKLHDGISCSGAYLKFLVHDPSFEPTALEEKSPYVIMFGPDVCGRNPKVHLIVRQKHPKLDTWEEKHMDKLIVPPVQDNLSHLYTLIIRRDNTYEVHVDGKVEHTGSLKGAADFVPPFGQPAEIDDPEDKKPEDWVDDPTMPDPSARKPEDWDEEAPATRPNPDAKKPQDWIDEDDGEWEAPHIPNPDYRGKWLAPMIDNPAYKGQWKPRKIPNPDYFEDDRPADLQPIGAIALEVLSNERGIAFDNILLTHDEAAAKEFAELTFVPKQLGEKARALALKTLRAAEERAALWNGVGSDRAWWIILTVGDVLQDNLLAVLGTLFALLLGFILWLWFGPESKEAPLPEFVEEPEEPLKDEFQVRPVDKAHRREDTPAPEAASLGVTSAKEEKDGE